MIPYQTIATFVCCYLTADVTPTGPGPILFNIIETDGSGTSVYNSTNGRFTAPTSGWYDIEVNLTTSAPLTNLRIIKNDDTNFPVYGTNPSISEPNLKVRLNLGFGEFITVQSAGATILALAGTTPNQRASSAIFTLIKRDTTAR